MDEDMVQEVLLKHGVIVRHRFKGGWEVKLPKSFPTGSWLHYEHSFPTLEAALTALTETGMLDAIGAYNQACHALSQAKQEAFTKIMSAHLRSREC